MYRVETRAATCELHSDSFLDIWVYIFPSHTRRPSELS
jgi:hypothetical protein